MSKKQLAFTLIELLVVIAIIGILSGLIVVSMSGVTQKATIAKAQVFSNSLRNSLMLNLVSEWKFDGMTSDGADAVAGDVLDTWSGGNNGSITIAPTVKTSSNCVSGSCLYFNGSDDYVSLGGSNSLAIAKKITVETWVKIDSFASDRILIVKSTGFGFNYGFLLRTCNGTPQFRFVVGNGTAIGDPLSGAVMANKWYHVVGTYDGSNVKIYLDGQFKTSVSLTGDINYTGVGNLYFGRDSTWAGPVALGYLDNVRIYSDAVPVSYIKEQYYIGLSKLLINGAINKEEYLSRTEELLAQK